MAKNQKKDEAEEALKKRLRLRGQLVETKEVEDEDWDPECITRVCYTMTIAEDSSSAQSENTPASSTSVISIPKDPSKLSQCPRKPKLTTSHSATSGTYSSLVLKMVTSEYATLKDRRIS